MKKIILSIFVSIFTFSIVSAQNNSIEIKKITQAEFEKMIYNPVKDGDKAKYKGKVPCIVDFYADWCGPCKMLAPILKDLMQEYKGKIIVYKVNIDEEKALARQYSIRNIPTLFLFAAKADKPVVIQGYHTKEDMKKYIEQYLNP
jgi:thioredoxin